MSMAKQEKPIIIVVFGFLYVIFLQILYVYSVVGEWSYYGFSNDFSLVRCFLAYVLCLLIFLIISYLLGESNFSKMVISMILLGNAVPCLVLYIYMPSDFIGLLTFFYMFLIIFELTIPTIRISTSSELNKVNINKLVDVIFVLVCIVTLFIWIFYAHFHIQLSVFDVYDTRLAARTYQMPIVMTYLFSMSRSLNPLIAIIYLHHKKYFRFGLSLIMHFLIFSISANKSTLFLMVFGIALYLGSMHGKATIQYMIYALSIGGILGVLEKFIFGSSVIIDVFFRRILLIPALLNYQYYEYFSQHGVDYYSQSIGGIFGLESKYDSSLSYIIGAKYYSDATSANNGLFSDAYANLGAVGVIIIPLLLVLLIKLADGGSNNIPKAIWSVSALQFYFSFVGSSFFTVLLSHGTLGVILIFYFINNQNNQKIFDKDIILNISCLER